MTAAVCVTCERNRGTEIWEGIYRLPDIANPHFARKGLESRVMVGRDTLMKKEHDLNPVMEPVANDLKTVFHVMTKPIGPLCNLDCTYCFYLEKENLYPQAQKRAAWSMQDDVLEAYIRQYIESQDTPVVSFAWQGGEPTLLGVEYFREVVSTPEGIRRRQESRECFPDQRGKP